MYSNTCNGSEFLHEIVNTFIFRVYFVLSCHEAIKCTELLTCAFCMDNELKQKWWLETTFNKNNFLEKMNFSFVFHLG